MICWGGLEENENILYVYSLGNKKQNNKIYLVKGFFSFISSSFFDDCCLNLNKNWLIKQNKAGCKPIFLCKLIKDSKVNLISVYFNKCSIKNKFGSFLFHVSKKEKINE